MISGILKVFTDYNSKTHKDTGQAYSIANNREKTK